jgi:hypothetical protein
MALFRVGTLKKTPMYRDCAAALEKGLLKDAKNDSYANRVRASVSPTDPTPILFMQFLSDLKKRKKELETDINRQSRLATASKRAQARLLLTDRSGIQFAQIDNAAKKVTAPSATVVAAGGLTLSESADG